jgi:hypothetical protein
LSVIFTVIYTRHSHNSSAEFHFFDTFWISTWKNLRVVKRRTIKHLSLHALVKSKRSIVFSEGN